MTPPGTPRFRFRAPDGSEVPVGSVEDLSSRLEAGELGPETPLFDAGTGSWARAGDVPVFQFVLEELRAEGRLPDEEEVVVVPDPPPEDPIDPGGDFEPIRHDADAPRPLAAPTVDPFELHLPLSNPMDPLEGSDPRRASETDHGDGPKVRSGRGAPESSGASEGPGSEPALDRGPDGPPAVGSARVAQDDPEPPKEPWFEDRPFTGSGPGTRKSGAEEPGEPPPAVRQTPEEESPPSDDGPRSEGRPESGAATDSPLDPDIDPSPLHAWLTHGPPTPGDTPARERDASARDKSGDAPAQRPSDRRPSDQRPSDRRPPDQRPSEGSSHAPETGAGDPTPPLMPDTDQREIAVDRAGPPIEIRTAWEDEAEAEDPRAARLAARRRRRNARTLAGLAAVVILTVGGAAMFMSARSSDGVSAPESFPGSSPGSFPGDPAADPSGAVAAPPAGLEAAATLLWGALPGQISGLVDSLRVDAGLSDAPPRDWLGGYYLANAGEFPEVVEFWQTYRAFVERLSDQDADLAQTAARRAMEVGTPPQFDGLTGADRSRLVEYVAERHARMRPARVDRFLHLQRTAEAALGLHEFLVRNGASISHSPALGRGVSADPVLEAVTETPAVRREMEGHLDRIFEALDRTRGGGQPSLAGLRSELFGSLGRPL